MNERMITLLLGPPDAQPGGWGRTGKTPYRIFPGPRSRLVFWYVVDWPKGTGSPSSGRKAALFCLEDEDIDASRIWNEMCTWPGVELNRR